MSNLINKIKNNFSKKTSEITQQILYGYYYSNIIFKNKNKNNLYNNNLLSDKTLINKNEILKNKTPIKSELINNLDYINSHNSIDFDYLNMYKNYCTNIQHRVFIYINEFGEAFFLGAGTHGIREIGVDNYTGFSFMDINNRKLYPYFLKNIKLEDCIIIKNIDTNINLAECKQFLFLISQMRKSG